jgi:trk system potassium uptake protein TrkH
MSKIYKLRPSHIIIISFAVFIAIGTILLYLPISSKNGSLSFIDSLFMSTSAVCVTGLAVVDVGNNLSYFGQIVLLFLFQIGGLGIMTFSTIFMYILKGEISVYERLMIQESFTHTGRDIYSLLKHIFFFTLLIEGIGAIVLLTRFSLDYNLSSAVYLSIFHSVAAFCNAGFSPFSDSLIKYQGDEIVNLTIISLIISGGLGFILLHEIKIIIYSRFKRKVSLHTKMTLLVTTILLLGGAIIFFILEKNNVLRNLSLHDQIISSLFQSVTARTAGFNTVDFVSLTNATLFIIIMLMFIGASPGSTGGGIKTTTLGVLFAIIKSRFHAREDVSVFNRTIPLEVASRSIAIASTSFIIVTLFTILLTITELFNIPHQEGRVSFIEIMFEVASAFGTVGLSAGITAKLTELGKLIICMVMFIGRLGPLTIALAVSREEAKGKFRYSEESLMVG